MHKLAIEMFFNDPNIGKKDYAASFNVQDDLVIAGWDYLAKHMFRECQMEIIYRTHRGNLPKFEGFSEPGDWSPSQAAIADLNRWAAHSNTAETWLQIQNVFHESAHLLAQAHAYRDLEIDEKDEDQQLILHLVKMQCFNSAVFTMNKIEDLFLMLLFLNSECSLIPSIDVHGKDWSKQISRAAINKGLKLRKSELCLGRFRKTNPYLNALADNDYRTIRNVFKKIGSAHAVRTVRNYRNAIAHRGLPAVDRPIFSPAIKFPEKHGSSTSLGVGGRAPVEYSFVEIYDHAVKALKHLESQLRRIKAISILAPQ